MVQGVGLLRFTVSALKLENENTRCLLGFPLLQVVSGDVLPTFLVSIVGSRFSDSRFHNVFVPSVDHTWAHCMGPPYRRNCMSLL